MKRMVILSITVQMLIVLPVYSSMGQIGKRFPSERKVVKDPVSGIDLVFLTSKSGGDWKIYPTHNQWTADGKWVIFESNRFKKEAMAVNEKTGDIVQVSEGGYMGMLNVARNSMKLYFMRRSQNENEQKGIKIIEVDLEKLFADSKAGTLKPEMEYQR